MKSPITANSKARLERKIPADTVIRQYREGLKLDVSPYFTNVDAIEVYECEKTGYQFYYPFNLAGKGEFYEELQVNDWYYMPWKWEHEKSFGLVPEGSRVLEVGCGTGDFLKRLAAEKKAECIGLELNESLVTETENMKIINQTIEEFAVDHEATFDVVCSFQVLEHIADIKSFIDGQVRCLKKGGLLIICVPNSDSFIQYDDTNVLNMPPHHMGLWNESSLRNLEDHFAIKTQEVAFEPLQPQHYDYYTLIMLIKRFGRNSFMANALRKFINTGGSVFRDMYFKKNAGRLRGHSILVTYLKKG